MLEPGATTSMLSVAGSLAPAPQCGRDCYVNTEPSSGVARPSAPPHTLSALIIFQPLR